MSADSSASQFQIASGFEETSILFMLAGAGCLAVLLWGMWALISAYKGWAKDRVDDNNFTMACLRVALLIIVFFWIFTNGPG